MTDQIEQAARLEEMDRQIAIANRLPATLAKGKPGECDFCGEYFIRIVDGACVKCREKYHRA